MKTGSNRPFSGPDVCRLAAREVVDLLKKGKSTAYRPPTTDYVDWLRFSFLATTTTLPSLAMPVGFTASGMPVGVLKSLKKSSVESRKPLAHLIKQKKILSPIR